MPWAVAAAVVSAGASYLSNKSAQSQSNSASKKAAKQQNAAIDKQIDEMKAGVARARTIYTGIENETKPGVDYLRNVISGSAELTPAQKLQLEDLRRNATNSSQVAGSALRGSGRSFVDAMRKIEEGYTVNALDTNQRRADAAATNFSTPYFNSKGSSAAAEASLGTNVGGAIAQQGQNLGNATNARGQTNAEATLANGQLISSTLGDIAGMKKPTTSYPGY